MWLMSIFEFINWVTKKKQRPILSLIILAFIAWQIWLFRVLPHGLNIVYGIMFGLAIFGVLANVGVVKQWFFKYPEYDFTTPFIPKTRSNKTGVDDKKENPVNLQASLPVKKAQRYEPKSASPTFDGVFDEILFYCQDKSFGKVFYGIARFLFKQIWLVLLTELCVANVWLIPLAIIGMFWAPHPVSHIAISPEEFDDFNDPLLHDPNDYH
jgi:hypothetical protein